MTQIDALLREELGIPDYDAYKFDALEMISLLIARLHKAEAANVNLRNKLQELQKEKLHDDW